MGLQIKHPGSNRQQLRRIKNNGPMEFPERQAIHVPGDKKVSFGLGSAFQKLVIFRIGPGDIGADLWIDPLSLRSETG